MTMSPHAAGRNVPTRPVVQTTGHAPEQSKGGMSAYYKSNAETQSFAEDNATSYYGNESGQIPCNSQRIDSFAKA